MSNELFEKWRKQIPMIDLMGMSPLYVSEYVLENLVDFEPNRNEKNTVLGGSLASSCALSGWMMCSNTFIDANVAIVKQENEFLAPIKNDFVVRITIEPDEMDVVNQKFQSRGKSSMKMVAQIFEKGGSKPAMQSNLVYVVSK